MNVQAPYQLLFAQTEEQKSVLTQYIQKEYNHEFHATIPHFLPYLLGLYRADGSLVGACGLNRADCAELYLEHYLDTSIEMVIADKTGCHISRSGIIEIGNFACAESGNARIMFAAICWLLCKNQFDYVVFTGTQKLRNVFRRLNLSTLELGSATANRIGADAIAWGEYYQNRPSVMAGDLEQGRQVLSQSPFLLSLFAPIPSMSPCEKRT